MKPDGPVQHTPEVTVPIGSHSAFVRQVGSLWGAPNVAASACTHIELRALAGDSWTSKIRGAEKPKETDKRLSHMPTPEEDPLSYAQFSELWQHFLSEDLAAVRALSTAEVDLGRKAGRKLLKSDTA